VAVVQRESAGARLLGGAADRPGGLASARCGAVGTARGCARPGGQQIAQDGAVLGQHHVELRDELTQVVLAVGHEPGRAGARSSRRHLDRLVGHINGLRRTRPQQAAMTWASMSSVLALRRTTSPVAPGLQRIQHDDAVPAPMSAASKVFPEVARGLEPDQGLPPPSAPRAANVRNKRGHSVFCSRRW